jgi:hypothetical protein
VVEMAVRSMEMAEMAMETDGDGSGGRVPEQRLLSPRNLSVAAAELQNSFSNITDRFRVFYREALIGGGAASEGHQGASPPLGVARRGRTPPHGEPDLCPPFGSLLVLVLCLGKIGVSVLVSSNSANISYVAFLKHKTAENRELAQWHLVNRLVSEIA